MAARKEDVEGPAPEYKFGPLPEHFVSFENGEMLIVRCRKCAKGFKLPKGSTHPGNKIKLMNHVRTHSEVEEL